MKNIANIQQNESSRLENENLITMIRELNAQAKESDAESQLKIQKLSATVDILIERISSLMEKHLLEKAQLNSKIEELQLTNVSLVKSHQTEIDDLKVQMHMLNTSLNQANQMITTQNMKLWQNWFKAIFQART